MCRGGAFLSKAEPPAAGEDISLSLHPSALFLYRLLIRQIPLFPKLYHGHDYMDLQRFAENTRHMVIFDVLTDDSPVGWKGERTRLFLSDIGYEKALDSQAKGQIKILSHAKVRNGDLFYDHKEQIR